MIYCLFLWLFMLLGVTMSPLLLIIILIVVLFFFCLILVFNLSNFFFCYLLFLLFMSGLVMMLVYFCSIILSEKFLVLSDFFFFGLVLFYLSLKYFLIDSSFDLTSRGESSHLYFELVGLLKYLIYPYSVYSLFFISYLLFCLVVVYEVVKRCGGPLRMKI